MGTGPNTELQGGFEGKRLEYSRGHFGVAIHDHKHDVNVDGLVRSARCFNADYVMVDNAYNPGSASVKHERHLPVFEVADVLEAAPKKADIVAVELTDSSTGLERFPHPDNAIYILGAEGVGLTDEYIEQSDWTTHINSQWCLNVETAGSLVLHDRAKKLAEVV